MIRSQIRSCLALGSGLLGMAALLAAGIAAAQHTAQSADDADPVADAHFGVAAIGRAWDAAAFAETVRLYTALQRAVDWPGVLEPETVRYGTDPQQTLMLVRPEQGFSEPGPVILFVHGNGLGENNAVVPGSDGLMYTHVGKLAAGVGGIGVVANYRTGQSASDRSGAEDLGLVVEWVAGHVAEIGGDPGTIVLIANAEGATNAATYLFDAGLQPETGPGIAAAILSSGPVGDGIPRLAKLIARYRGERVPLALFSPQLVPASVETGIADINAALCRKYAQCPWFVQLHDHNMVSAIMSLGTPDTSVSNELIRFYHTVR